MDRASILSLITDSDDKAAYENTKRIAAESESSNEYYGNIEDFASLLNHEKSYIRVRAFMLCCSQAKWDKEDKLNKLLPCLMAMFHDPKPTAVRQCLKAVRKIVVCKPELSESIKDELGKIDLSNYKDSMRKLITADISELQKLIEETCSKTE